MPRDSGETIGGDRLGSTGDDLYAVLMEAHEGLNFEDSARLNARLVLLLMNTVGDTDSVRRAIAAASLDGINKRSYIK